MSKKKSNRNIELAGEIAQIYSILDTPYVLTSEGVKRRIPPFHSPFYLYRTLAIAAGSHRSLKPLVRLIRKIGDHLSSPR